MRSLLVISAGLSQPSSSRRLADMLAEATRAKISARGEGTQIDVIEIRDLAFCVDAGVGPGPGVHCSGRWTYCRHPCISGKLLRPLQDVL